MRLPFRNIFQWNRTTGPRYDYRNWSVDKWVNIFEPIEFYIFPNNLCNLHFVQALTCASPPTMCHRQSANGCRWVSTVSKISKHAAKGYHHIIMIYDTNAYTVAPSVQVPSQLLGAPLGSEVQLQCLVEASPAPVFYWLKGGKSPTNLEAGQPKSEMLLDG